MRIEGVTICGADDEVDRNALYELSDKYPFVEWGILYYPKKQGSQRYPSGEWIEKFDKYAPGFVTKAIHLCGDAAEYFCKGDLSFVRNSAFHSPRFDRIQVNIPREVFGKYSDENISAISDLLIRGNSVLHIIIQVNYITFPLVCHLIEDTECGKHVRFLIDSSRGKGEKIRFDIFEQSYGLLLRNSKIGFAGGIDPENVRSVISEIKKIDNSCYNVPSVLTGERLSPPSAWIDMESGVRTNNKFDLEKVEKVLKIVGEEL